MLSIDLNKKTQDSITSGTVIMTSGETIKEPGTTVEVSDMVSISEPFASDTANQKSTGQIIRIVSSTTT